MIKYSILVPVYNVEKYLGECLDSLAAQDFPQDAYEVILTDDGSTDTSSRICDEYMKRYANFRVIHQENAGLLLARKTGVINAEGEYLLFVDADDYVDRDLLAVVDGCIQRDFPDFLMFSRHDTYANNESRRLVTAEDCVKISKREMLRNFCGSYRYNSVANKVVKKNLLLEHIDEIYIPKHIDNGEDRLQTAYLIKYSEKIDWISSAPYHYRRQGGSITFRTTLMPVWQKQEVAGLVRSVIAETAEMMGIAEEERREMMIRNDAVTLDDLLDHIFKYNVNRVMTVEEKRRELEKEISKGLIDVSANKEVLRHIKIYNRVRFIMLKKGQYRKLLSTDYLLKNVQAAEKFVFGRHVAG